MFGRERQVDSSFRKKRMFSWKGKYKFFERSISKEKDFLSPGVRKSFSSGRVPAPCVERILWKEKDFLSPGMRKSFYSGRVLHTRCGEISFYIKGLPFTRCEDPSILAESHTRYVLILFLNKRTSFHQV